MEDKTALRGYLATALTDLPDARRAQVYKLCQKLKSECRKYGLVLYLPFEHTDPNAHDSISAPVVYETDSKQVITSDILFALCEAASYGVGQENQIALSHGVPVFYLIQKGCTVSRMLLGCPTRSRIIEYETPDDLFGQLAEFLPVTVASLRKRREALGNLGSLEVGKRIKDLRVRNDMSAQTLADLLGVGTNFITNLEEVPHPEEGLSLKQTRTLAALLGQSVEYILLGATARLDERMRRSRENLRAVAKDEGMTYDEYAILWEAYQQGQKQKIGFVAATRNTQIVSKEQWRLSYRKLLEKRRDLELDF